MPTIPHSYALRHQARAMGIEREFDKFALVIDDHGYEGMFAGTRRMYINLDGWRYWKMEPLGVPPISVLQPGSHHRAGTTSARHGGRAMRAAGYIRVSTEEQRVRGWNLGADRDASRRRSPRTAGTATRSTTTAAGRVTIPTDRLPAGWGGRPPRRARLRDLDRLSRKPAMYASAFDDLVGPGWRSTSSQATTAPAPR